MILIIDNYDSFTYNLYHLAQTNYSGSVRVHLSNATDCNMESLIALSPKAIIISPGPGSPAQSPLCLEIIRYFASRIPILGICLGHQLIATVFGDSVGASNQAKHGYQETVSVHKADKLFKELPTNFKGVRYHSLTVQLHGDSELTPLAFASSDGELMAMRHRTHPIFGLQFHPESYGSDFGNLLMINFIKIVEDYHENTH